MRSLKISDALELEKISDVFYFGQNFVINVSSKNIIRHENFLRPDNSSNFCSGDYIKSAFDLTREAANKLQADGVSVVVIAVRDGALVDQSEAMAMASYPKTSFSIFPKTALGSVPQVLMTIDQVLAG